MGMVGREILLVTGSIPARRSTGRSPLVRERELYLVLMISLVMLRTSKLTSRRSSAA